MKSTPAKHARLAFLAFLILGAATESAKADWIVCNRTRVLANLAVGYTFSTLAQNQLQAMQMTMFFLLPAILLSGFAFAPQGKPSSIVPVRLTVGPIDKEVWADRKSVV